MEDRLEESLMDELILEANKIQEDLRVDDVINITKSVKQNKPDGELRWYNDDVIDRDGAAGDDVI